MAEQLDSHGCPEFKALGAFGDVPEKTAGDRFAEFVRDWAGPTNNWNTPDQVAMGALFLKQGEVDNALARVEQASATGANPAQQAYDAFRAETSQFLKSRGDTSTIPIMSAFHQAVLTKLQSDNPKLVEGMSLAWAAESHGQMSSDSSQSYCLNWNRTGVNRTLLDRYLAHEIGSGSVDYYMAANFNKMWDKLNPSGGSVLNHVDLGETASVPQKTIEQKLAEINTSLMRKQAEK